jgi:hypothetical protein
VKVQCDATIAYDSVKWEVCYNIFVEFGEHMKPITLIKMYLDEFYSRDLVRKHLCDDFHIRGHAVA